MQDDGKRLDRYEIREIIGRGAMGVVYRAHDPVIGRIVALKTISLHAALPGQGREDSLERFAREARAAGLLSHPNIVTIYDVGESPEAGSSYIAMEYVEGRTLRQMVPHGDRMPQEDVLEIAVQVARALDYAHRRGVIHRDIKPANILVREDGLVKLADFGVARIEASDLTRTGQSVGSPSYIAPEMLQDQPVDGRADLFSLGVILFELLTGEKPFRGESLAALYHQIINQTPSPPSRLDASLPAAWDAIVMRLLEKDPEGRYRTAQELIEDLRCLEQGRPLAHAMSFDEVVEVLEIDKPADPPDPVLERVIEEGMGEATMRIPTVTRSLFTPQIKALLALLTITGFALAIIMGAAVLRRASAGPAILPPAEAAGPAPVGLTVRLAHGLRQGRMELSMDGASILTAPIRGERSGLRVQGALSRRMEVAHGRHVFKITVSDGDGRSWSGVTTRDLDEGADATLFVEMKGLLRKSLDLTWY